ncbi:hypothetical protein AJ80_07087 [Polytolypa hystricis UAMH7299]|uniref:TOG domain-containing protein n=1 Tax=Polytolypa hystricis (strain UAMH7299) TaxID=1447883 RepID=A0A2B7XRY0_POLH7|nr:hypothetical protein AJ80_07087 [Polytolypa hystricis UAMH7299]
MEVRATEVLAALKNSNLSIETKATHLTKLKSEIKQKNVPEGAVSAVFDALRVAISSQQSSLSAAGFSSLGHLLKRLSLQELHGFIISQGRSTYPLLLEKLGDHKERIRAQAAQAFSDFWLSAPTEVEHLVLEVALVGKNPRAKETSMVWLGNMSREQGLLFRTYVPNLVACLEDADSGVREKAKMTVIELFQNAPSRALSDLKRQLQTNNVRKSITNAILNGIGLSEHDLASSTQSQSSSDILRPATSFSTHRSLEYSQRPPSVLSTRSYTNGDALNGMRNDDYHAQSKSLRGDPPTKNSLSRSTSIESFPTVTASSPTDADSVEPLYVNSHREFDDMIRDMIPFFEGRESEQNWSTREKSVITLRRLTKANAPHDYQQYYLVGIKTLLDGILKTVTSLRTTVSTAGCSLIQEIARTCGPAIDHMVEILLQTMIKVCAGLKKISAQNGNLTVDAIIANVTYSARILQHLWAACQDKNVQPRLFVTGWIKTIITKHGRQRSLIEHSGGLELIEKCIKKGLGDANPGVRESMRGTFWTFAKVWPDRGELISSALDAKSRGLLEKDPGNPNADLKAQSDAGRSRSRVGMASGASGASRLALKETIAAQKKARLAAAKSLPARPESAQSTFPDVRSTKTSSHRQTGASTTTVRTVPIAKSHNTSLSSAPMRPGSRPRRPELARPATADPYARRPMHGSSQSKMSSPAHSPQKPRSKTTSTPAPKNPTPARPKSRLDGAPISTAKSRPKRPDIAVLKTGEGRAPSSPPSKGGPTSSRATLGSPVRPEEDFVAFIPKTESSENFSESAIVDGRGLNAGIDLQMTDVTLTLDRPESRATAHQTPQRHQRLGSDGSVAPVLVSPSFGSHHPDEQMVAAISPRRHESRNNMDDIVSRTPVSVARHSLSPSEIIPADPVKVYEDPQSPLSKESVALPDPMDISPKKPQTPARTMPLEELPINEPASVQSRRYNQQPELTSSPPHENIIAPASENTHRRWKKVEGSERRRSLSPRSKDPTRARDMIDRGLTRIRARAMDVHGYRKLQSILKYHADLLQDEDKYAETLMALLEALEGPEQDKRSPSGRSLDLKTQILVTVRLMASINTEYFSTYHARAMTALITARRHYEMTNHIVSGLEETSEDIVATCDPPDVIEAVLDLLETEEKSAEGYRMVAMGIYIISGLLHRLNEKSIFLNQPELDRLGKFARQSLGDPQPDIRRAVIEFCLELHTMVKPEDTFWHMINSPVEDFRPLLTYYLVRKPSRV